MTIDKVASLGEPASMPKGIADKQLVREVYGEI